MKVLVTALFTIESLEFGGVEYIGTFMKRLALSRW